MAVYVTTEMHTGGDPVRIVEKGYPEIKGATILEKLRYLKKELDRVRKLLMWEPRGHFDMYGVVLVPADNPSAVVGAIFMHNDGYATMCGHAVISLGRYLVDKGFVKNPTIPETVVNIQCPCGLVETRVQYDGKKTGAVRFFSVPSFLYAKDVSVEVPGYGTVIVDIAFGGTFYAIVHASQYNMDIKSSIHKIRDAGGATTDALRSQLKIVHPEDKDLTYLTGTIITDGKDDYSQEISVHRCVYAERADDEEFIIQSQEIKYIIQTSKQFCRAPCGSGVTARIAQQFARNLIGLGQTRTFESPTGATFNAKPAREVKYGEYNAVVVEVSGHGYYTGKSTFTLEEGDDIGKGFLLA